MRFMTFSGKQLAAIFRLGKMMANADGRVEKSELVVLIRELARFGVPGDHLDALEEAGNQLEPAELLGTIAAMDANQKKYVAAYLGVILAINGDIDDSEMKLWGLVSALCNLPEMNIAQAIDYLDNMND